MALVELATAYRRVTLRGVDKLTGADGDVIRVIYITPGGIEGRGGMGRMARYLVSKFASQPEIHLRVLDSYGPGRFWLMPIYFVRALVQLSLACLRGQADLVHIHVSFGGSALRKLLLMRIANSFDVPAILHIHGSKFAVFCDALSPPLRKLLVRTMQRAARIVVIGKFWQRYLVEDLGIVDQQIAIVPNGVPVPQSIHAPTDINGSCRIVCLGALGRRKGTSDLLQALSSARLRPLKWDAVIAGNGAVEDFRAEAIALGIADRIEFPGWIGPEKVQDLLRSACLFVLPSYNEGLPVAILEAMAAGLPVVTTRVGAIPDLGIDGEAGFLIDPGSIAELADRLELLIRDETLRVRFGARSRQLIERDFTVDVAARRLTGLYRDIIGNP